MDVLERTIEEELLDLLEGDYHRIRIKDRRALHHIAAFWIESGRPRELESLAACLDKALKFCTQMELHYPKFVLKRLKQLQRREWLPASASRTGHDPPDSPSSREDTRESRTGDDKRAAKEGKRLSRDG